MIKDRKSKVSVAFYCHTLRGIYLHDGDDGYEDRRGTQPVLVKVPASVRLARQDLVGHVTNKTFVQAQPRLVQQDLPLQRAAAIGDGSSETAGALTAHLQKMGKKSYLKMFLIITLLFL